ncbi:uncharacterized protein LOC126355950 [Schistocerca gregaria]|uniref:uncharacterized protein LOC126355950 n=1 Tax=Schistocerca gregaria TaxID=7010 RepID=UPI00211E98B3|nr:uncharacterized protein LOC126355950 [Schistocerca gregaria]
MGCAYLYESVCVFFPFFSEKALAKNLVCNSHFLLCLSATCIIFMSAHNIQVETAKNVQPHSRSVPLETVTRYSTWKCRLPAYSHDFFMRKNTSSSLLAANQRKTDAEQNLHEPKLQENPDVQTRKHCRYWKILSYFWDRTGICQTSRQMEFSV